MILVTGANGFIGKALIEYAKSFGHEVRGTVRTLSLASKQSELVYVPSLDKNTDWSDALRSCETVIHLAAKAHRNSGRKSNKLAQFMEHNCEATLNLIRQAEKAGVKKFIFLSSTGVMGPQVTYGVPYDLDMLPNPHDAYTKSKLCAEQGLLELSNELAIEVIILRVPLVYGPNAPGSIGSLIKAIKLGIPLPFGGLFNRRHLISIDNLVELVVSCISSSASADRIFIASDNEAISTSDLCYLCGYFAGKPPRLIKMSPKLIMFIARLFGKQKKVSTLINDFELESNKTNSYFRWSPGYSPHKHVREIKNNISS